MRLVSQAEPRGNRRRTLIGEDAEVDDLRASASGPPMEATWLAELHPPAHVNCSCSLPTFLFLGHWFSPLSVDSFKDTSDEVFPGIEIDKHVGELFDLPLALLSALSDSWSDRGQSSKKCRRIWPSDLPSPLRSSWISNRLLFWFLVPEELQRTQQIYQEREGATWSEQIMVAEHKTKTPLFLMLV